MLCEVLSLEAKLMCTLDFIYYVCKKKKKTLNTGIFLYCAVKKALSFWGVQVR